MKGVPQVGKRKFYLQLFAGTGQEPAPAPTDEPSADGGKGHPGGEPEDGAKDDPSQADDLDPKALKAELERARKEAAKYRNERKQWQEKLEALQAQLAQALGLKKPGELEAEKVAQQFQELQQRYRQERLRNTFYRLADKHQADVELAYAYMLAAGDFDDLDVEADDFEELLGQRLQAALKANPKLRRDPQPAYPAKSGAEFGAGQKNDGPKDLASALAAYYQRMAQKG